MAKKPKSTSPAEGRQLVVADDTDDVVCEIICRQVRATGEILASSKAGGLVELHPDMIMSVEARGSLFEPRVGDVVKMKFSGKPVTIRRMIEDDYVVEFEDRSTMRVTYHDIERIKL